MKTIMGFGIAFLITLQTSTPLYSQTGKIYPSLKYAKNISIFVNISFDGDNKEIIDLKRKIKNDVELKLRLAKIDVNSNDTTENFIYIKIIIMELGSAKNAYVCSCEFEYYSPVMDMSSLQKIEAITWRSSGTVSFDKSILAIEQQIRNNIKDDTDMYIVDYLRSHQ